MAMITLEETISEQLDEILDTAEAFWSAKPVFKVWGSFNDQPCRCYAVGDEVYRLVTTENEQEGIASYAWVLDCN